MKKSLIGSVLSLLVLGTFLSAPLEANQGVQIALDGKVVEMHQSPKMIQNSVYVPVRAIGELLGSEVIWKNTSPSSSSSGSVSLKKGAKTAILWPDVPQMLVDGKAIRTKQSPKLIDGKVYLPLRLVSEAFDIGVSWNQGQKKVELFNDKNEVPSSSDEKQYSFDALVKRGELSIDAKGNLILTKEEEYKAYNNQLKVNQPSLYNKVSQEFVFDAINAIRTKYGLGKFSADATLQKAANKRAKEITSLFSHTRPGGKETFTVLDEYGYDYKMAGENIARGQNSGFEVVNAWMNSKDHRENILKPGFKSLAVGLEASEKNAWVQLFGTKA